MVLAGCGRRCGQVAARPGGRPPRQRGSGTADSGEGTRGNRSLNGPWVCWARLRVPSVGQAEGY